ncbi:Uncharacterised protein [BD1-7 clade bacterium]|uniref:Uncharacterized protein n=1 Tax=BD1-7 clade bacterium TaxID=2029982 RepID=A0A5S9QS43_9GAMM|nr:Uncharacterised protein [BD1-7 clade bacterium]
MNYTLSYNDDNQPTAVFERSHLLFGYWLQALTSENAVELDHVLGFAKKLKGSNISDYQISNKGYYLQLTSTTAKLVGLSVLEDPMDENALIVDESDEKLDFANTLDVVVTLDELIELLTSWRAHITECQS